MTTRKWRQKGHRPPIKGLSPATYFLEIGPTSSQSMSINLRIQWLPQAEHGCTEEHVLNLRIFGRTFIIQTVTHTYGLLLGTKTFKVPVISAKACPTRPLGYCPAFPLLCSNHLAVPAGFQDLSPQGHLSLCRCSALHLCGAQSPVPPLSAPLFSLLILRLFYNVALLQMCCIIYLSCLLSVSLS